MSGGKSFKKILRVCSLDRNSLNGVSVSLWCISQFCFLFTLNIVYLIESSNEGQFAFTVESIVMVQKLRGTLTYVIKVLYNIILCRGGGRLGCGKGGVGKSREDHLGHFTWTFWFNERGTKIKKSLLLTNLNFSLFSSSAYDIHFAGRRRLHKWKDGFFVVFALLFISDFYAVV